MAKKKTEKPWICIDVPGGWVYAVRGAGIVFVPFISHEQRLRNGEFAKIAGRKRP